MDNFTRDDVLYFDNSTEPQHPIILDPFLIVTKIVCAFVGVPLNMSLAIIIIRIRRLHSKPRNVFVLGITLSNLFVFVPAMIELMYSVVSHEFLCNAYVVIVLLPYAILLLNILFALIDRYVAITYPLWHKKWITVRCAKCLLFLGMVSLTVIMKFIYVFNIASLRCKIRLVHVKTIGLTTASLFLLCFVVHVIVYLKTMTLLCPRRTLRSSASEVIATGFAGVSNTATSRNLPCELGLNVQDENLCNVDIVNPDSNVKLNVDVNDSNSSMNIHVNGHILHKMEIEATRALIFGVTSLFVMAGPVIVFFLTVFILRMVFQYDCGNIKWLAPYVKEMGLLHSVYNPLVFLFRNNELHTVLKNVISSWSSSLQKQN